MHREPSRLRTAILALLWCLVSPLVSEARVLIIGVDGASWNVIEPMMEAGELPHLSSLARRGIQADLATVEPVTSPVVWTSIATGRSPEAHGVTDFLKTRLDVRVPTVYERLAQQGVRVGLYDVLMTWPPVELPNGFVIPGWLRRNDVTTPANAAMREDAPIFRTVYDGRVSNRDYLEQARREVREKVASWHRLDQRYRPEVGALTFYAVDATSHRFWHLAFPDGHAAPATSPEDERAAVFEAVRGVDRAIGEILEAYGPDDMIVVLSDHGFQAMEPPNLVWVTDFETMAREAGLDPERDGFNKVGSFMAVTIRIAPGAFPERDRTIQKVVELFDSYRSPEGDPLFFTNVVDVAPRPPEFARAWTDRLWQWGVRFVVENIFDTEIDSSAQAMVLALPRSSTLEELWPDGLIRAGDRTLPIHGVVHQQPFTGTHHPTAVLIAAGGPIQASSERTELSVLDVAPLVLYAAGSPLPDDLEGRLPIEHLDPAVLAARPPRLVGAAALPGLPRDELAGVVPTDPALTEKLRALGYLAE